MARHRFEMDASGDLDCMTTLGERNKKHPLGCYKLGFQARHGFREALTVERTRNTYEDFQMSCIVTVRISRLA